MNDPGFIAIRREIEDSELWLKPPLYLKVWLWLRFHAIWESGEVVGYSYSKIAEDVSWVDDEGTQKPSKSHIFKIVKWLKEAGFVGVKVSENAQRTLITIVNNMSYENLNVTPENAQRTLKERSSTILDEDLDLKHGEQAIAVRSPDPPTERQPLKKTRTPKPGTGDAFVTWVDETFPHVPTRKAFGRYVKSVNALLSDRKRENPDAYNEIVKLFSELQAGGFDHVWPFSNPAQPKEIPPFCQHYGNLLVAASQNGKHYGDLKCPICNSPSKVHPDGMARCSGAEIHGWTP